VNQPLFTIGEGIEIDLTVLIGIVASFVAFVLYISTAMIYASVKFLEEWHHWLTVANYTSSAWPRASPWPLPFRPTRASAW